MSEETSEAATPAAAAPAAPKGDTPKRVAQIVAGALVVLLLASGALWVRGTSSSSEPLAPKTAAEGTSHQLYQTGERTLVQAAAVVDRPLSEVWAVVTDYEHFSEIFQPPLWTLDVAPVGAGGGAHPQDCRLEGAARSRLWTIPVAVDLSHSVSPEGVHRASWDSAPEADSNRGSWTLTPLEGGGTRILYEAEIDVPPYPRFMVHNLLLSEVDYVVNAVRDRAGRSP